MAKVYWLSLFVYAKLAFKAILIYAQLQYFTFILRTLIICCKSVEQRSKIKRLVGHNDSDNASLSSLNTVSGMTRSDVDIGLAFVRQRCVHIAQTTPYKC